MLTNRSADALSVPLQEVACTQLTDGKLWHVEAQSLLVEGGAQTLQSFLDADLWDEVFIEQSEIVLGDGIKAPEIKIDPKGRPIHVNFA